HHGPYTKMSNAGRVALEKATVACKAEAKGMKFGLTLAKAPETRPDGRTKPENGDVIRCVERASQIIPKHVEIVVIPFAGGATCRRAFKNKHVLAGFYHRHLSLPQSSSASHFPAGAAGFFDLPQHGPSLFGALMCGDYYSGRLRDGPRRPSAA